MKPLNQRILMLMALFEGSAGGKINTWDGEFLSLGSIHYAVGQGSGARFLIRVQQLDPAGYLACLGAPMSEATKRGVAALQAFCRVNIWKTGARWQPAFTALSRLDAYAQADAECAQPYLDGGRALARRYGLSSERGLAFCMDRAVQQGPAPRAHVDRVYARVKGQGEQAVMVALAHAYAATANPKYAETVRRRSLTVAYGTSSLSGYPGAVDLARDFDLTLTRLWDAPDVPRVFLREPDTGKNLTWDGDESAVYGGQRLSAAWVAQMLTVYPPGAKTRVSPTLTLQVYDDGALQLTKE